MSEATGNDVSLNAAAYIAGDHVDYLFGVLYEAKRLKDSFTEAQRDVIEGSESELERLNLVICMSKMSDSGLAEFEQRLMALRRLADASNEDLFDFQEIKIITMFMMLLGGMKPRSKRHLENFLNAITDGDWMDGFIMGKGSDTEFRCVDRADVDVRKAFGLN